MKISINRINGKFISSTQSRHYDGALDVLLEICDAFDGYVDFHVEGFGDLDWPVDVATDLPAILDQLPNVIDNLLNGRGFKIEFYEQGVERTVVGNVRSKCIELNCFSMTAWEPNPAREEMEFDDFCNMLKDLVCRFIAFVNDSCPESVYKSSEFIDWKESIMIAPC